MSHDGPRQSATAPPVRAEPMRGPADAPALQRTVADALDRQQAAIAAELHDALGAELAGLSLMLGRLLDQSRQPSPGVPAEAAAAAMSDGLRAAQAQLQRTVAVSRTLVHALAPPAQPLHDALQELAGTWTRRGMPCVLSAPADPRSRMALDGLAPAQAMQVVRIAQEALTNAWRHGGGAPVRLAVGSQASACTLVVDQQGLPHGEQHGSTRAPDPGEAGPAGGHGLRFMQIRAQALNGRLHAGPTTRDAAPGHTPGWRVELHWPCG